MFYILIWKIWWSTERPTTKITAGQYNGFNGEETPDSSTTTDQDDAYIRFTVDLTWELDPITKKALAEKFSPIMLFNAGEQYFPIEIDAMLEQSDLKDANGNILNVDKYGNRIDVTEQVLMEHNSADAHLDQFSKNQVGYDTKIYANVFTANDDRIVIQYWFFYIYQNEPSAPHEGDWEMIQLVLPQSANPLTATPTDAYYSQHYDGEHRTWADVQKETWVDGTIHPKIYVGAHSHPSHFSGGETIKWTTKDSNYNICTVQQNKEGEK